MRTAAGYLSATMLLLLIGYVIGYAVCLWRYVDTGDTHMSQPLRETRTLVEHARAVSTELPKSLSGAERSAEHVYEQSPVILIVHVKDW